VTTVEEEQRKRKMWKLRPGRRDTGEQSALLEREFLSPKRAAKAERRALTRILQFAAAEVPYYRARLPRSPKASDLSQLPLLQKQTIQQEPESLRPRALPSGVREGNTTRTSGTTGQPTVVHHTVQSTARFGWLKAREARWWGVDPRKTLAGIRTIVDLPRVNGEYAPNGQVLRMPSWPYFGRVFETGAYLAMTNTTPLAQQLAFLRDAAPHLLIMQAAGLEQIALGSGGIQGLEHALAISQTLTSGMRLAVERELKVQVHQNYGLNEIGLVASQCTAGRYHVHAEHAHVEILDSAGQPTPPGQRGRLVVSALDNFAMPLLRYDTDDLAVAVDGPCPCGRSLPSFGEVVGRYRRIAYLPQHSWKRWGAIQLALYRLPANERGGLRRYQAHQSGEDVWTLRVDADDIAPLERAVRSAFDAVASPAPPLEIYKSTDFLGDPFGKFQAFLSDFNPDPGAAPVRRPKDIS